MTRLRAYQLDLVKETADALRKHRSVLLQAPTASGKTQMACAIAREARTKVIWFVCHRREILEQTSDALKQGELSGHAIMSRGYKEDPACRIQVCSIDALRYRIKRYPPPDLIILDECHHVAAPSWAKLIERFPDAKLLGLTATPLRLDGIGLEDWFEHLIVGPTTRTLIGRGFLSKFRMFAPSIPDLRGVRIRGKDYDPASLESAMDKPSVVGDAVEHYKRLTPNARALAFTVSVKASKALVAQFKAAGIPAVHVDWKTPRGRRSQAVADLASGVIRVLSNVNVFTEGFDVPAIDAVILLRPTKSFGLYRQMIGRCLRVAKDKVDTVILDHAGNIFEHDFPDNDEAWSLSGRKSGVATDQTEHRFRRCPVCNALHRWSSACPECGYAYKPRDRTVEEIYGELREISETSPKLYEAHGRFASRCKVSQTVVTRWIKKEGLPTHGPRRLIKIEEGLAWVKANGLLDKFETPAAGYERIVAFSKRAKLTAGSVRGMIKRGLPVHPTNSNWLHVENGLRWLRDNPPTDRQPYGETAGKYEPRRAFSDRIGSNQSTVGFMIDKHGLPAAKNGWVSIEAALQWLKSKGLLDENGKYIRFLRAHLPTGFDSKVGFARRLGKTEKVVHWWVKKGLPVDVRGLIPIDEATRWVNENINQREGA